MSQTSMTVPWSDGGLEDFSDLHSAIRDGRTQTYSGEEASNSEAGSDQESGNESDEEEVEPSPDDHGDFFNEKKKGPAFTQVINCNGCVRESPFLQSILGCQYATS